MVASWEGWGGRSLLWAGRRGEVHHRAYSQFPLSAVGEPRSFALLSELYVVERVLLLACQLGERATVLLHGRVVEIEERGARDGAPICA